MVLKVPIGTARSNIQIAVGTRGFMSVVGNVLASVHWEGTQTDTEKGLSICSRQIRLNKYTNKKWSFCNVYLRICVTETPFL